jgi:APA family basic amino acid/polyamine antiporter
LSDVTPVVRVGAAVASLGVLLSLLAGVSRTIYSMARRRELPGWLDAVHHIHRTPHRAEFATGVIVCVIVVMADLRSAIGFSSFAVLTYYALTNASAWTLPADQRRSPRWIAGVGLAGCVLLAFALPGSAVVGGVVVLAFGSLVWRFARTFRKSEQRIEG